MKKGILRALVKKRSQDRVKGILARILVVQSDTTEKKKKSFLMT